jgi:8-oxo-dGTP pyrophosphatase MutT (NUDIX family)
MSSASPSGLLNVFQPGLVRGAAKLDFAPHKRYFYVEHPEEGWRVYLRAACFLHEVGQPFEPSRFLVVKRKDANPETKAWEPPKGQMEGKDAKPEDKPLIELMAENVRREVLEEAKIKRFHSLMYTGLVVQSREPDYPDNHYFQYHIFQAKVTPETIQEAQEEFTWLNAHPAAFARLRSDKREKDALAWYSPSKTRLMGKWSPSIVALYIQSAATL